MAEMTPAELTGAIKALEKLGGLAGWLDVEGASKRMARDLLLKDYRAQLAALPPSPWTERERRLREVLGTFLGDIVNCHPDECDHDKDNPGVCLRTMRERDYLELSAALAEPAPAPSPDLRAALVEAREALKGHHSPFRADGPCQDGLKTVCMCASCVRMRSLAAIARIEAVLGVGQ